MISIIKESQQDFSFLLKLHHLSPEQKLDIESAICAEGDSNSYDCGDYLLVVPNDDFTTFDKMSAVIRSLMDKYGERVPDVNESWHYKFEDLKPVFASEIQGGMDPNDEYYPRQAVDAAICELRPKFGSDTTSKDDLKKQCIHLKKLRCKHNMFDCLRNIQKLSIAGAEYEHGVESGMPGAEQALATLTAKVALWTKWADRWQKLANCFGGSYDYT